MNSRWGKEQLKGNEQQWDYKRDVIVLSLSVECSSGKREVPGWIPLRFNQIFFPLNAVVVYNFLASPPPSQDLGKWPQSDPFTQFLGDVLLDGIQTKTKTIQRYNSLFTFVSFKLAFIMLKETYVDNRERSSQYVLICTVISTAISECTKYWYLGVIRRNRWCNTPIWL